MMSSRVTHGNAVGSAFAKAGTIAFAIGAGLVVNPVSYAGTDGATVVNGDVTIQQNGPHTIITASDGSIINFTNFDIMHGEVVQFIQPHDMATVLNRVLSNDPTQIHGQLLANGRVFLVNPAGVVFGQSAVINVGSLFAAAGNISNQDFLSGNWQFGNLSGNVLNEGAIHANDAYLLGKHVSNRGIISANGGIVAMMAGNDILIREHGERITVRVDGNEMVGNDAPMHGQTTPDMLADPGVENAGSIHALDGQVVLGAGDLYGYALLNSGTIRADGGDVSMTAADGLVHNSGLVSTSVQDGTAGSIVVQGPSVLNSGQLHANADSGQAGYIEVTSQNHTYMTDSSLISAAGGSGFAHGGEVLVHSYAGETFMPRGARIDMSGGALGGAGGFVEVSGLDLFYQGSVDLGAHNGFAVGHLLLDPFNIVIQSESEPLPFQNHLLDGDIINFTEGMLSGTTYISSEAIEAIIGDITLEALGSIFIFDTLNFGQMESAGVEQNLFLFAGGDIVLGFDTGIFGANNVTMQSNFFGDTNGEVQFNSNVDIFGDLNVYGALAVINTSSIITGGYQNYHTDVDICVDAHLQASNINFFGAVDATFSNPILMSGLEISLDENGLVVFDGDVGMATDPFNDGAPRSLRYLIVNGDSQFNGSNVRTLNEQIYNGQVLIGSGGIPARGGINFINFLSTNGGDIRFKNGIEGPNAILSVFTQGTTEFTGEIGSNGALGMVRTDEGGQTELAGNHNSAVFDYGDMVMLTDDVTMNASSSANFSNEIDGQGHSLDITSNFIHFQDNVMDMDTLITSDFNAAGGGVTLIGGIPNGNGPQRGGFPGIVMQGNSFDFGTDVELIDNTQITGLDLVRFGGSVDGAHWLLLNSNELIEFNGNVGQVIALDQLDVNSLNLIHILGDAELFRTDGDMTFNAAGRPNVPEAATIGAANDLTLQSLNGEIILGQNEKLTVVGALTVDAATGFTAGDLNSLGDMNITAPVITLLGRDPGNVLLSNGQLMMDDGLDIVSGGAINFSVAPVLVGGNGELLFVTQSGTGISAELAGFDQGSKSDLTAASFKLGDTFLDLTGGVATPPENLARALSSADLELEDFVPREPFAMRPTDRLAIFMRSMTNQEMLDSVEGRIIHVDLQSPGMESSNPPISTMRLRRDSVLAVVNQFETLYGVDISSDDLNDEQLEDNRQAIRNTLGEAWNGYIEQMGDDASPLGFSQYLQARAMEGVASPAEQDALDYLRGIDQIYENLRIMGATAHQAQLLVNALVEPLRPDQLTADQFAAALESI